MVFIYTTCKDMEEAKKIANLIVKDKMAASVNFWPIESMYLWHGEIRESHSVAIRIKTLDTKIQVIEDLILKHHSSTTPFIEVTEVKRINPAYKEWMSNTIV